MHLNTNVRSSIVIIRPCPVIIVYEVYCRSEHNLLCVHSYSKLVPEDGSKRTETCWRQYNIKRLVGF
jgi:hypothetical protein